MGFEVRNLSNSELIDGVVKLVGEERRIGIGILEFLQEIERRKVYCELGYEGLFSFCVKKLKYSEPQASVRIAAMWALTETPEIKPSIVSGSLTVTTVAQVQVHVRKQKLKGKPVLKEQKMELFQTIQDQSSNEVKKTLAEMHGEPPKVKLMLELDEGMLDAWTSIKNLSAHSTKGQGEQILNMLMTEWLKKNAPARCTPPSVSKKTRPQTTAPTPVNGETSRQPSRFIPIQVRRAVWFRDAGRCQQCKSKFALQIDHIKPFATGGANHIENLRLLCRNCNLHRGIQQFGTEKMNRAR